MAKSNKLLDLLVVAIAVGIALLVSAGMFSNMTGGGLKPAMWFAWHPVLMTVAFPCLMTLGRWSYVSDDSWGVEGKPARRILHGSLMGMASVTALIGYVCIFMAHLAKQSFFGYNFATDAWSPQSWRIFHSIFGYVVLLAMLAQATVGLRKAYKLTSGIRTMTFHGMMGKVVIFGGAFNIAIATWNWAWNGLMTTVVMLLLIATLIFAMAFPSPSKDLPSEETQELLEKKG